MGYAFFVCCLYSDICIKYFLSGYFFAKNFVVSGNVSIFAVRNGVLAQLVERLNGIQKVRSSILLCSTKIPLRMV